MIERAHIWDGKDETHQYAGREDFRWIFMEDLDGLYQLALLLTRDSVKAEQCFVGGFEDCVAGNSVFREWAHSWAKRAIIQSAIRKVKPRPSVSNSRQPPLFFSDIDHHSNGPTNNLESNAVFRLEDYERFVFVMSVLEHYSDHDCALILECLVPEVREARTRALKELASSPHMDRSQKQSLVQEKK